MLATLGAIARIVLDQWVTNERPFPLVQVQASLLEEPEPGFAFNQLFRSPNAMWGLGTVIAIDLLVCLNTYSPKHFPTFPLKYDFTGIFSEEPLSFLRLRLKKSGISFIVVGVTFFMRSRALSVSGRRFIILNLVDVQQACGKVKCPWRLAGPASGRCIASWPVSSGSAVVTGSASSKAPSASAPVAALPQFWVAIGGVAVMLGWLCFVGVQPWMAGVIVLFIIASHLIVARVVAETGLPLYRTGLATSSVHQSADDLVQARDIYFASVFNILGPMDRESLMTFATTGLAICKRLGAPAKRLGWAMIIALSWACSPRLSLRSIANILSDSRVCRSVPRSQLHRGRAIPSRIWPPGSISSSTDASPQAYSTAEHITIGFGVTVLLEVASLRYASWPFLPVGYVASYGSNVENAWFSIFVGWLCQVLIVRFGGASLFQKAKPFFIGSSSAKASPPASGSSSTPSSSPMAARLRV